MSTPRSRLLRRGNTVSTGYPMNGLVAYFDMINVTGDPQTLPSLYGKSPTLQRGATSGAEASDGSWEATGWEALADDYLLSPALDGIAPSGPFTAIIVCKFPNVTGNNTPLSLATTNNWSRITQRLANVVCIGSGPPDYSVSGDIAVSTTSAMAFVLTCNGATHTLMRMDTGVSASVAVGSTSETGARLGIGCLATPTVGNIMDSMTASLGSLHNVALSTAQTQRAYRAMKARAGAKGVTIL